MSYQQKYDLLRDNLINLKRKKLLPNQTMGYWDLDPKNITKLLHATEMQTFKEWKCKDCNITVYGPKKLMLEHHKIHSQKRDLGDNEIFQRDYKLY